MPDKNKIKYEFIDSSLTLNGAIKELEDYKIFYIDTEFVSNRNSNTLCLIQVSNGEKIFLFDTIKLRPTLELASIICSEDTKWILHSGHQDIYHLVKYFKLTTLPKIFDCLQNETNEIIMDAETIEKARKSVKRMAEIGR